MKTCLLTAFDGPYSELGSLTLQLAQEYSRRHGFALWARYTRPRTMPALWWKLLLMREALESCERVLWMDADVMITNPDCGLNDIQLGGMHLSRDWGLDAGESQFSCGCYVAHRDCLPIYNRAIELTHRFKRSPFGDQDALRAISKDQRFADKFTIYPRRRFNAVPIEVHPSAPEPWQPGDFAAHLTMLPLADRINLFHQIKSKI